MSDLETRLSAALHDDAVPARDPRFRVEVLLRLERARFRRRVALTLPVAAVIAVIAAASAPALDAWVAADIQRLGIVAVGATVALLALSGVLMETTRARTVMRAFSRWLYP